MESDERRRRRKLREARQRRKEALRNLSPDELLALRWYARNRLEALKKALDTGSYVDPDPLNGGVSGLTQWERNERIPSDELRPGAPKMILREDEEEDLPLTRMGHGNVFSKRRLLGQKLPIGQRDFAWGIFASPEAAQELLSGQWAQRRSVPELFFFDVLNKAAALDLTLMLLTSRPLPVAESQRQLEGRLKAGAARLSGGTLAPEDEADIQQFVRIFDEEQLAGKGLVERGRVKEGTHIILSAGPKGELFAEAITPGVLRDRKGWRLGGSANPKVLGAMFEMFLGLEPLDQDGKLAVGEGLLWCANGFRMTLGENPNQYASVEGPDGRLRFPAPENMEWLPMSKEIFHLVDSAQKGAREMLLGRIRRAQQRQQQGSGAALQT